MGHEYNGAYLSKMLKIDTGTEINIQKILPPWQGVSIFSKCGILKVGSGEMKDLYLYKWAKKIDF